MRRMKGYKKHIACVESMWEQRVERRVSVLPMLKLIGKLEEVRFTYLTCNTAAELSFNLKKIPRKGGYAVLYFAFHGRPGQILLADGSAISLRRLAGLMEKRFRNWIVHFGACDTLAVADSELAKFVKWTRVGMVAGYTKAPDWMDGTALDLLFLYRLQFYEDMRSFWRQFSKTYKQLISTSGFRVFPS